MNNYNKFKGTDIIMLQPKLYNYYTGIYSVKANIVKNPHGYTFVQSDATKYKNMKDYTIVIGTSNTMATAGVDPTKNIL